MKPIISVIIPCYNQARYLPDAIESILLQTLKNWECIIVNDGSRDNVREILLPYLSEDNRIHLISQENRGLSGARNTGVEHSTGKYLQFLDADDLIEEDKLRTHVSFLEANTNIDLVYGDARYFTTEQPYLRDVGPYAKIPDTPWIPQLAKSSKPPIEILVKDNMFTVNCPVFRRTVFDRVGVWNESLNALEDYEYWIRCAANDVRFFYIDASNTFALVRMHSLSMTQDLKRMSQALFDFRISTGQIITDSSFRSLNFSAGVKHAWNMEPLGRLKRVTQLATANKSFIVFNKCAAFIASRQIQQLAEKVKIIYKKNTPWSVQKALYKIISSKRD